MLARLQKMVLNALVVFLLDDSLFDELEQLFAVA